MFCHADSGPTRGRLSFPSSAQPLISAFVTLPPPGLVWYSSYLSSAFTLPASQHCQLSFAFSCLFSCLSFSCLSQPYCLCAPLSPPCLSFESPPPLDLLALSPFPLLPLLSPLVSSQLNSLPAHSTAPLSLLPFSVLPLLSLLASLPLSVPCPSASVVLSPHFTCFS